MRPDPLEDARIAEFRLGGSPIPGLLCLSLLVAALLAVA